ncbi:PREDICTED: RING finger protein 10 isoform X2 [Vollenhovia emeryi]|uniref:RING finger protein 10 isoform X2 n=1 Tax=Vollenhovia emeryi TaxID=411798 RepID=UPI0005F44A00|nr:PREDICTED: RING finger protein 10 isoform X2 [Vollenhovia emeryi]
MDIRSKFTLSPAKGAAADARRNKDVNKKLHLGTLRRREPAGANNFANDVQPTKYNVQKAKDLVKRQRPKGQYHGGAKENPKVVEEKLPELGSVLVPRRKKNGNHLLNFHYERYRVQDVQSRDIGRHGSNSNRLLPPVQRHKYCKEQFIQASCQFVVTASRDYSLHLTNPDILVDWKSIEQIIFHSSENLSCPICLHPPVAGKVTRCGHVYCWPCILRYLRYCQETGNYKCPICYEYLHKNDLKSVIEITRSTFNLGETINLCLMRREKNSLFATPVKSAVQPPTTFLSVSENADNQIYSKLLIANVKDIVNIIESEYAELQLELEDNPDMAADIKQALDELSKRKEKLLWQIAESKDAALTENTTEKEIAEETSQRYDVNVDPCYKEDDKSLAKQSSTDSVSSDGQTVSSPSKFSYFYQSEDGQHIYLHAANVKMLEMEYGALEDCPHVITGKLLEKEGGIYTEELRRRLRYLCHLPVTCSFELVEIELKPPLVSKEVLHAFHEQLNSRQKYREQKEREERKREKKIIEEENRQIGIYPTPNIDIESYQHFPELQSELQLSNENALSPSESAISSIASSPASSAFDEIAPQQETDLSRDQARTFADIMKKSTVLTKMSNKSVDAWPAVKSKTHSSTSNACFNKDEEVLSIKIDNKSTNAWPSVASSMCSDTPGTSFNEDEKKPYVSEEAKDEGNASGKKKKKKKGKGTVLFTTALATNV